MLAENRVRIMLNKELEGALNRAFRNANNSRYEFLTVEHLLLAMIDVDETREMLESANIDVDALKSEIIEFIEATTPKITDSDEGEKLETQPTLSFQRVLQRAVFHIQSSGRSTVTSNNVIVALFSEQESHAAYLLKRYDLDRLYVVNYITGGHSSETYGEESFEDHFDESLDYKTLFNIQAEELDNAKQENARIKAALESDKKQYENKIDELTNKLRALETIQAQEDIQTIVRSVEFPPQYHLAGLNILSFFGSYLRERYPSERAKVKIEQDGYLVRLIIETEQGHRDIIERALHEYELVLVGEKNPSSLPISSNFVHELTTELKMTKLRLEITQERLEMQNGRVDQLLNIISGNLSSNSAVSIDFKPSISSISSANVEVSQMLPMMIGTLRELYESSGLDENLKLKEDLKSIDDSLQSLDGATDRNVVSCSSGMSKLRRFLEEVTAKESTVRDALSRIDNGITIVQDLCTKYNSVAEWCGLPQVPKVFTKHA